MHILVAILIFIAAFGLMDVSLVSGVALWIASICLVWTNIEFKAD